MSKMTTSPHNTERTPKSAGNGVSLQVGPKQAKFQLVDLAAISIVERPTDGGKSLFFNPRSLQEFTPEKLGPLRYSIRIDEIQCPLLVRAITDDGSATGQITRMDLIAGERRLRSCREIYDQDLPCYSEDVPQPVEYKAGDVVITKGRFGTVASQRKNTVVVSFDDEFGKTSMVCPASEVYPTVSGREKYCLVPVKLYYNITDEKCLSLAWTENDNSEPLSIADEIKCVERLDLDGYKQIEIAELLRTNITFVSQTLAFRKSLPPEAFERLVKGKMVRHVAVGFLSYSESDRLALFERMKAIESAQTEAKITKSQSAKEEHEDSAEVARHEAARARSMHDDETADRLDRRASVAETKAKKEEKRLKEAEDKSGHLTQGHQQRAAAELGVSPRRAKSLVRDEIEERYVKGLEKYTGTKEHFDPVYGEVIPSELVSLVQRTAKAIVGGEHDPLAVIREHMVASGKWTMPESQ